MVRQVNTVCGCCVLEQGCVIIAICRVVLTIVATFTFCVVFFNDDLEKLLLDTEVVSKGALTFYTIISIPFSVITILFSYWFVRGTKSTNKGEIDAMFYYFGLELVTIIGFVARFSVIGFVFVGIEFYVLCCSAFLIAERQYLLKQGNV